MKTVDAEAFFEKIKEQDLSYMQQADVMECIKDTLDRMPNVTSESKYGKYLIINPDKSVETLLLVSNSDGTWSFVNLTKGHICEGKFPSFSLAVMSIVEMMDKGVITNWTPL